MDIRIRFLRSGYRVADSIFKNVPKNKIGSIIFMLSDNTAFNLGCDKQCNAVTYIDLIAIIDQKINN